MNQGLQAVVAINDTVHHLFFCELLINHIEEFFSTLNFGFFSPP